MKSRRELAEALNIKVCPTCDGTEYEVGVDGATQYCTECEVEMIALSMRIKLAVIIALEMELNKGQAPAPAESP